MNQSIIAKALDLAITTLTSIGRWDQQSVDVLANLFTQLGEVTGDNEAALDDYSSELPSTIHNIVKVQLVNHFQ